MLILPAPTSSYDTKSNVTIRGTTYTFTYRWNSRASVWKLDIESINGYEKVYGLTLTEKNDFTSHLQSCNFSWEGFLMVFPVKNNPTRLGRDNFGPNKDYQLFYVGYIDY